MISLLILRTISGRAHQNGENCTRIFAETATFISQSSLSMALAVNMLFSF